MLKCTHNQRNANHNHTDTVSHLTDWQPSTGVTTHAMVGPGKKQVLSDISGDTVDRQSANSRPQQTV